MVRVSAVALADLSARRRAPPSCRRQRRLQPVRLRTLRAAAACGALRGILGPDLLPACPPAPATLMTAS